VTDWDNLEGDELNVALARVLDLQPGRPLPDWANSIDAQKRDLEPLLDGQWVLQIVHGTDGAGSSCDLASSPSGARIAWAFGSPESLARARCLGKALEARHSKALEH
jgi:hypothetical protein